MNAVDLRRVDFALIPENPLFTAVIGASQAITDEFYYNSNVIDDTTFPPHLSLHICTVPHDTLPQVVGSLKALATTALPDLVPIGAERADGGYVMLNIEPTAELMTLHDSILRIAVEARENRGLDKYGSPYIREFFTPHMSLAKVDYRDQAEAVKIARETLRELSTVPARTLDLCEIGERSERWEILASLPR